MPRRVRPSLVVILLVVTCKDATAPILVDRVFITGPTVLHIGQHGQFIARPVDAQGNTLARPVAWSSSDTTIATVTPQGLVTARELGSLTINAAADGRVGIAPLSVTVVPVVTVDVQPRGRDSLYVGDSLQLTATPRDSGGGPLANRSITWATSDSLKGTVSASGLVRARGAGSFTVTATSEGLTGGTFLNAQLFAVTLIMPDSFTLGLRHVVRLIPALQSASGTRLSGRPMTWSTSDYHVLAVEQNGVISPLTPGAAYVSVRSDTLRDSSLVRVVPEPAVSLTLAWTATTSIADTSIEALQAVARDGQGFPTAVGAISWTSSDTTVVRIAPSPTDSSRAVLTGVRPGVTRISVQGGSLTATYDLTLTFPLVHYLGQPDSMMMTAGDLRFLYEVGLDRFGNEVSPPNSNQSATSGDTSIVSVILGVPWYVTGRRPGRTFVALHLTTPSGTFVDTVPVIVNRTNARRLYWTDNLAGGNNYSSGSVELTAADTNGALSTVPRDIQISSSDTSIAFPLQTSFLGMTGRVSVPVRLGKPGVAVLTATGDSQFATLTVSVRYVPPSALHIAATSRGLRVGDTLRLHATIQDAPATYPILWRTTNPARATVSDSGTVTAVGIGDVGIVALSGTVSDTAALTILSGAAPTLSAATPLPLVPGAQVTLTGSGFDPNPAADAVLIDSVAVLVTSASDTALTMILPAASAWPCTQTHNARVLVTAAGRVGLDSLPLRVGNQHAPLVIGDVLDTIGTACIEMPATNAGASYAILVNNTNQDVPASFAFRGAATIENPPPPRSDVAPSAGAPALGAYPFSLDSLRRAAQVHRHILERSRTLTRRLGAAAPLLRAARQAAPLRSVTAMINNVAAIRIPKLEDPDFCSSYQTVQANLVYAGTHVLIFEDRMAPLAGTMTSEYQALGLEFDNVMYPKLLENFGNPLAMDSLLDGDGRLAMVFSPVVNTYGAMGFVVSCDFYPESVAPSSNTGEIFYAQVPTAFGTGFQQYTADVWRWLIGSVVMHESKHLTAYAERLSRGAPIEDTWLEESSAVLAEELWSRPRYGSTWKGDASYRLTVYCDVRPTFPECNGRPYSMFNAFAFLYDYTRHLEQRTPLGPTSNDDATFYGSGWSLLRWTIDQTATSESEFLRALVQEPSLTGLANLSARAQRPADELLSDWSGALYFDSWGLTPPATHPAWTIPSWRMSSIFQGMSTDFPSSFPTSLPLQGRRWVFGGDFIFNVPALPPGGWALFVGFGPQSLNQLFDLHTTGSSAAAGSLRIHIARVQ